ncbi:Protein kinase [Pleurostoma richardsiae]|uniref:Protein kinase n=1 Tax=Pleurostoma richardsiae TaxID=41990 RepID=A0AA38VJY6_9PEZI|nr:Protein kinase [Pleurostoma richardsiae]
MENNKMTAASVDDAALPRWISTASTVATDFDPIWDNDPSLYPTQDTVDSLAFNDDDPFFGCFPFSDPTCAAHPVNIDLDYSLDQAGTSAATSGEYTPSTTSIPVDFPDSPKPSVPQVPLKEQLSAVLCPGDRGRLFVPDDALHQIVTDEALQAQVRLITSSNQTGASITSDDAVKFRKIFAVLTLIDQADKLPSFLAEGIQDADLALVKVHQPRDGQRTFDLRRKNAPDVPLASFQGWTQSQLEQFDKSQWLFLSPVFSSVSQKKAKPLPLEDKVILPFTESTENAKKDHYRGGNSEVFRVKLHPAHHDFAHWDIPGLGEQPSFAVKRLLSTDEETFRREVEVLQRLSDSAHPHVVSLLATYKYKGYYHLMFPWAEGDLRRLWNTHPNPNPGRNEARWLASQCSGIASALNHVHNGAYADKLKISDSSAAAPRGDLLNGRHGDIKPENILVYNRPERYTADPGFAKLSDFGGGLFFDATKGPDPLHQVTKTYRPPEYDTKCRPVSQSWDVWGLGCTFVEFVTWFLEGSTGLNEFAMRRTTYKSPGVHSDEYFELFDPGETGTVTAFLKGSVLDWITDLYCHKNSSKFIRDFLEFITNRMFFVETEQLARASSAEVSMYLTQLTKRCFEDDAYCLPSPGGRPPWVLDSLDGFLFSTPSSHPTSEPVSVSLAETPNRFYTSPTDADQNALFSEFLANMANHTAPAQIGFDGLPGQEKKRKRSVEDDASPSSQQRNDKSLPVLHEQMHTTPVTEDLSQGERRFACPFYKNNPCKFRKWRTCGGPGWPTVHRVKEHLYRRHTIGKHTCSRCMLRCKSAKELLDHQRATVPCEMRSDAFPEGTMMPCQEEALRVKKRAAPNTTEEQRWAEVYKILFPGEDPALMPSPYYEDEARPEPSPPLSSWHTTKDGAALSEYEKYLSGELPSQVRRELETEIKREFGLVADETQMGKVVDIARRLQLRLFRHYETEQQRKMTV